MTDLRGVVLLAVGCLLFGALTTAAWQERRLTDQARQWADSLEVLEAQHEAAQALDQARADSLQALQQARVADSLVADSLRRAAARVRVRVVPVPQLVQQPVDSAAWVAQLQVRDSIIDTQDQLIANNDRQVASLNQEVVLMARRLVAAQAERDRYRDLAKVAPLARKPVKLFGLIPLPVVVVGVSGGYDLAHHQAGWGPSLTVGWKVLP